jgi:hypothetical protein
VGKNKKYEDIAGGLTAIVTITLDLINRCIYKINITKSKKIIFFFLKLGYNNYFISILFIN